MITKLTLVALAVAFTAQSYGQQPAAPTSQNPPTHRRALFVDRTQEYMATTPATMELGKIYHAQKILDFNKWRAESPEEAHLLNRFPEFVQQKTLRATIDGSNEYTLTMYVARTKFLVNKPANQIDFSKLISIDNMKKVDPTFVNHATIQTAQTMPEVDSKKWGYANAPDRKWCTGQVMCVQTRFNFGPKFIVGITGYNSAFKSPDRPPHQTYIDMQTEVYSLDAARINGGPNGALLQRLTQLPTPPQSMITQTAFYVSDFFEYAKIVTVVQDNPSKPGTSIVTSMYAIALRNEILKKAQKYEGATGINPFQVIQGNSPANGRRGPEKGLGPYTTDLAKALQSLL